DHLDVMMARG
nr:Chain E, Peptide from Plastid division protein PDV1 [Arabidopsis thaliana]6JZN_F Chain F, Peptide from Plastid division protein PDV1 [Arabidopsis thaliana]6JZN_G Chain G, Peptide from Plastid division protein PDV1 [Arabidopsis thaliana]6JZN_H Chain H, Peptide from Plastid division protein PDV1 [Arabidopsis thaliana]